MPTLQVLLLGPPQIRREERPVQLSERKSMALVAYLALSPTVRGRDELAALLWPEHPKSRDRLRHALWAARKAVGEEHLVVDREFIGFRRDEDTVTDVLEFHKLLAAWRDHTHTARDVCDRCLEPLGAAIKLYRGDFLSGFSLADSPTFDDWQSFQTESLRRELGDALGRLVRLHSGRGEFEPAIEYGRRRLALDPLHEPAQRALMRLYAWADQVPAALRQYGEFVALLDEEIGVPPDQETIDLAEAIRAGGLEVPEQGAQADRGELRTVARNGAGQRGVVRNLPVAPGLFVGRRDELDELVRLLRDEPNCRLLTLVGLGGVGKTALAIRTASEVAGSFEQGVVFAPLAEVDEDAHLPLAIASALGAPIHGSGEPKTQLINFLAGRELLLVLDNFEQLMAGEGTSLLVDILAGTTRVKLLVTSRERLKLSDEWGFELSGLLYPTPGAAERGSIEAYSAVQLFWQSARRARPGLALTGEHRQQVLRICRLVDGLPLALKLAAGWSRIMTFRQIADEVQSNLDFLESTVRDVPDRHKSIKAVLTHSWALLPEAERNAFMKLSVFRGGFTPQAAENVAGASLPMLLRLADKSLIQRTGDGRFQLHELLRRYATEQLEERPGKSETARDAHANYFATFLARRTEAVQGVPQENILAELTAENDNIRAAWGRGCAQHDLALISRSVECLVHYHMLADRFQEARMLCGQGVESLKHISERRGVEDELRREYDFSLALLFTGQGYFSYNMGHTAEGQRLIGRGVNMFRQLRPKPRNWLAWSLSWLGNTNVVQGNYSRALDFYHESLEIRREIGDRIGQGGMSAQIGLTESYRGNYREGEEYVRVGAGLLEEVGNRRLWVVAKLYLGLIARAVGEFDEARRRLGESMRWARSLGQLRNQIYNLREMSQLELDLGNDDEAERRLEQGMKHMNEAGFQRLEGFFQIGLGVVARRRGRLDQAGQRFDTSMSLFRASSDPRGVGISLQKMGDLALEEERLTDAERLYRESLSQFEAIEHGLGIASATCSLGSVLARDPTRQGLARGQFQRALSLANDMGATPVSLDALLGLAVIASQKESSRQWAAEWLGQLLTHPAGKYDTKEKARELMADLESTMEQEELDAAVRRGQARELDEILAEASSLA